MINVEITGSLPVINTDFTNAMIDIRELMYASVMQNFTSGGRPTWAARTKSYPWPILRKTDKMYNAIGRESGSNYAEVSIPNSINYAKYHQDGTRKMPMRMFMMFQPQDYDDILKIFGNALFTITGPTSSIGDTK
jgi:phage gpG-like protein